MKVRTSPRPVWRDPGQVLVVLLLAAFLLTFRFDSVPAGLNHDEGANGRHALGVLGGNLPIFFLGDNGQEPLFIYLQAAAVAVFGRGGFPLRLVPMFLGLLTVSASYVAFRAFFGHATGLLAATGVATSFWHLLLSRLGVRSVSMTLCLTIALYLLWRAMRRGCAQEFVLAGLALGLTMYTYLASRLAPFLVLAIVLCQVALDRRGLTRWRGLALAALASLAVFAPLGAYFLLHPGETLLRTSQVSVFAWQDEKINPAQTLLRTAGMFFLRGQEHVLYNIPGRPVFLPPLALFFCIGALVALCKVAAPTWRAARGPRLCGYLWTLLWLVFMCLPSGLTFDSPQFQRAAAAIPPAHALLALGILSAASAAGRLTSVSSRGRTLLAPALACTLFALAATTTFRDYFGVWANLPDLIRVLLSERSHLDRFVATAGRDGPPQHVYLTIAYQDTQQYLFPALRGVGWFFDESTLLPLPARPSGDILYVFPGIDPMADLMKAYLPRAVELPASALGPNRRYRAFLLGRAEAEAAAGPRQALSGQFAGEVELLGASLRQNPPFHPGDTINLALTWRYLPQGGDGYSFFNFFVHLADERGNRWAQDDHLGRRVAGADPQELQLSVHTLAIPADAPPLKYRLEAGVTRLSPSLEPVPSRGAPVVLAELGLTPAPAPPAPAPPATLLDRDLLPGLHLQGFDLSPPAPRQGDTLTLEPQWHVLQPPTTDFLLQLRLLDPSGALLAESTTQPLFGQYPPSTWQPGQWLRDRLALAIPPQAPPALRLQLRLLEPSTQQPLAEQDLGPLQVLPRPRRFTPPAMQHHLQLQFGQSIRLIGYDLPTEVRPGERLRLALYWQATAVPERNYTVFTHLLGPGERLLGQHDGQPAEGASPTTSWAPGEIVRDEHTLALEAGSPPGTAQVAVGLYDASHGQRLSLVRDGQWDTQVLLGPVSIRAAR